MGKKVTTSIILFKKQTKRNGKHPVKLRATFNRKQMYYSIDTKDRVYDFTPDEFNKILSPKPRGVFKEIQLEFSAIETKAKEIIASMDEFSFTQFKARFGIAGGDLTNIIYFMEKRGKEFEENNQFASSIHYRATAKKLKEYFGNSNRIDFREINISELEKFERWVLDKGLTLSAVRNYAVSIRGVFNIAMRKGAIPLELYPFGRDGYKIPIGRNVKKALKINEIEKIYNYPSKTFSNLDESKDLWLFSYLMNGANIADIARLRFRNIDNNFITFIRKKTEKTCKRTTPISVPLTDELKQIIDKWGNKDSSPDNYVFNILEVGMSPLEQHKRIDVCISKINRNIKIIGKELNIDKHITTYTARHSFSTVLKRSGVSTEFISESLGHNNLSTTQLYLDSFEDDKKKEVAKHLTAFK